MTIPEVFEGLQGPVTVKFVDFANEVDADSHQFGLFSPSLREVHLSNAATPAYQREVFWHEFTHVAVADAGAQNLFLGLGDMSGLKFNIEELICDLMASALVRAGVSLPQAR